MNSQELLSALVLSEQKIGLVRTLHCFYGSNVTVSISCPPEEWGTGIDELCFSVRSQNALKRASVFTVGEVIGVLNRNQIEKIRNLGRKSVSEIKTRILQFGFDRLSDDGKIRFFQSLIQLNPEKTAHICKNNTGQ